MHLFFIYYFLSFSERWVRPTSYQHFCRCSWWSCMLLLVIRLWRTSLHTLAKHRHLRQNECKKKGSVMKKSLFSLSLRKPDSSLYSDLFPPNSEFARNSTGNEISAEYFIGWFSLDCQSDLFRHSNPSKLRKTVRFAVKYFHPLRMPSAINASAKQKRERKTKYFQQKNLRKTKT